MPPRFNSAELCRIINSTGVVSTATTTNQKMRITTKTNAINHTWLGIVSLCGILIAPLQNASAQSDQDLIEVARSVVSADRKAVVVAEMELTDTEANDFWPLYHKYRSAMDKVSDDRVKLILKYARLY